MITMSCLNAADTYWTLTKCQVLSTFTFHDLTLTLDPEIHSNILVKE